MHFPSSCNGSLSNGNGSQLTSCLATADLILLRVNNWQRNCIIHENCIICLFDSWWLWPVHFESKQRQAIILRNVVNRCNGSMPSTVPLYLVLCMYARYSLAQWCISKHLHVLKMSYWKTPSIYAYVRKCEFLQCNKMPLSSWKGIVGI